MTDFCDFDETWTPDNCPNGVTLPPFVRVRWVWDESYKTRGSYALSSDSADIDAENYELAKLETGELVTLGCIVEDLHGVVCFDSLWGIVIEPDINRMAEFFNHSMEVPTGADFAREFAEAYTVTS